MSRGEGRDDPATLLRKAAQDEAAVHALLDSDEVADSILGFHAQQAVEKLLKAVLASRQIDYPFTHDIERLIRLLRQSALEPRFPVAEASDLTGWAAAYRYGEPDEEIDRIQALTLIEAVRAWAESLIE